MVTFGHRPDLPYQLVASATPCGPAWLVATAKLSGGALAPEQPQLLAPFTEVVDLRPTPVALVVQAPIGGLDESQRGGRSCDREARSLLGQRRGAAVGSAPSRRTLESDIEVVEELDAVTATLLPRYREVAAEISPFRQRWVYEFRAELSFLELNEGSPMQYPKRSDAGMSERRALLEERLIGIERLLDTEIDGVAPASLLDVAAGLWTARRIVVHAVVRLPEDPEWDSDGLLMAIVR
jgi:predicted RNase H-like nuclease